MNQPCTEQNFIPKKKKKKKPNQTNVNLLCKQEEILSREKKKSWLLDERAILSNIHLPHFLSYFLPILERLNFVGLGEKTSPTTFLSPFLSQPNTLSTHFLSYFPLFFIPSSLKSTQSNIL